MNKGRRRNLVLIVAACSLAGFGLLLLLGPRFDSQALSPPGGNGGTAGVTQGSNDLRSTEALSESGLGPRTLAISTTLTEGAVVDVESFKNADASWGVTLFDALTNEVVPLFQLKVMSEGGSVVSVTTDEDGHAVFSSLPDQRTLSLLWIDHPRLARNWKNEKPHEVEALPDQSRELSARIPVGPTYRIRMSLPQGLALEDLEARLESPAGPPREDQGEIIAPLRSGELAWVRFGPIGALPAGGPPWLLRIEDRQRVWFGSALVETCSGVQPRVVDMTLTRRGKICGTVLSFADEPIAFAVVTLSSVAESDWEGLRVSTVDSGGGYCFDHLLPGEYSVTAVADGFRYESQTRLVDPGGKPVVDFLLERERALTGFIEGELRSATGRFSMPTSILLVEVGGGLGRRITPEWKDAEGGAIAPFEFRDVPLGEYTLRVFPVGGLPWDRYRVHVSPPESGLIFICRDDVTPSHVSVRLFDLATSKELPVTWFAHESLLDGVSIGGGSVGPVSPTFAVAMIIPGESAMNWIAGAPGYRPAYGDESRFHTLEARPSELLVAEVGLEKGWGMELAVLEYQPDGKRVALPGAKVFLDGRLQGRTGRDGRIRLSAATAPQQLKIRHGSWKIMAGDGIGSEGMLKGQFQLSARVWMHRK